MGGGGRVEGGEEARSLVQKHIKFVLSVKHPWRCWVRKVDICVMTATVQGRTWTEMTDLKIVRIEMVLKAMSLGEIL